MYDEAIKIDPKFVHAYNGKGSTLNINNINRNFALEFIKILRSHWDVLSGNQNRS